MSNNLTRPKITHDLGNFENLMTVNFEVNYTFNLNDIHFKRQHDVRYVKNKMQV